MIPFPLPPYPDIIHGKLDQKNGILELDHAIGRDIKSEDLPNIVATLQVREPEICLD